MKRSAFVLFSSMAAVALAADGGMIFYPDTVGIGSWIGPKSKDTWTPVSRKFVLKSKSDRAWVVDGFRVTIPNAPGIIKKSDAYGGEILLSANKMDAADVLTGPDRWEFRIGGGDNLNTFQPQQTKNIPFMAYSVLDANWTPQYPHHWLTKTGSFATNKGYIDAPAVKVAELGTVMGNAKFYDSADTDPGHSVPDEFPSQG